MTGKLYAIIKHSLAKKQYVYSSNLSEEELKKEMDKVFSRRWYDLAYNFKGSFTGNGNFYIKRRGGTFVSGKLYSENNSTYVIFAENPFLYLIVCIVPGLFWIVISLLAVNDFLIPLIYGLVLLFLLPIVGVFLNRVGKGSLREDFAKTFKLNEIKRSEFLKSIK